MQDLLQFYMKSLRVLSEIDRKRYLVFILTQIALAFLDILALLLVGAVAKIIASSGSVSTGTFSNIFHAIGISKVNKDSQFEIVAILIISLLIIRSLFSAIILRKTLDFLSIKSTERSIYLLSKINRAGYQTIRSMTEKEFIYKLTSSTEDWALRVLSGAAIVISEISIIVVVSIFLLFANFWIAVFILGYFMCIFMIMHAMVNAKAKRVGRELTKETIFSNELLSVFIKGFRELQIQSATKSIIEKISKSRSGRNQAQADWAFIPNLSKYILEISLVVGVLLFYIYNRHFGIHRTEYNLALFFLASLRIGPSFLRVQQNIFIFQASVNSVNENIELENQIETVKNLSRLEVKYLESEFNQNKIVLQVINLNYRFPGEEDAFLSNINFNILQNECVVFIGASGSGKSTLVECLLGLRPTAEGEIRISINESPRNDRGFHKHNLGYVPQKPLILNASLRENLQFFKQTPYTDSEMINVLASVSLTNWLATLPQGLDSTVGETGINLSGGQAHRIAIARSLICNPRFLVLDEPTSALDPVSDFELHETIKGLKSNITLIIVAHRESSIAIADKVGLIDGGNLIYFGSKETFMKEKMTGDRFLFNERTRD